MSIDCLTAATLLECCWMRSQRRPTQPSWKHCKVSEPIIYLVATIYLYTHKHARTISGIEDIVLSVRLPEGPEVCRKHMCVVMATCATYIHVITVRLHTSAKSCRRCLPANSILKRGKLASLLNLSALLSPAEWLCVLCVCSRKRKSEEVVGGEGAGKKRKVSKRWLHVPY